MIMLDLVQGSEEWFREKLAKPSASNAEKIITTQGKPSKQREAYMYTLAAEAITGQREESYKNGIMQIGNDREQESRDLYSMVTDDEIKQVGVIYKNKERKYLCSPDGICEKKQYGLELKNVLGKTQVKYLLAGELPIEYFCQVQFSLYVTGFDYWMFCSYCPAMKPLIVRVERDEEFIKKLSAALEAFCKELDKTVKAIA